MNKLQSRIKHLRSQTGMTVGDSILLIIIMLSALFFFLIIPGWALPGGKVLEIRAGDKLVGRYSLNNHKVVKVSGRLGTTSVIIEQWSCAHTVFPVSQQDLLRNGRDW